MAIVSARKEGYIPRLPEEFLPYLTRSEQEGSGPFPRQVALLVAAYTYDFFGCEQWRSVWGAIPVSLPSLEEMRLRALRRVIDTGERPPKLVEEMSVEECANFTQERGTEEHPEAPAELCALLNAPVRPGELPAALTCGIMFIPQYVRREGRILAVNPRNIALEIGPNPRNGYASVQLFTPEDRFNNLLKHEDTMATQPSCFFVMELRVAPDTRNREIDEARNRLGNGWTEPEARNCMAMSFALRAWKGDCLFYEGNGPVPICSYTFLQERDRNGRPLLMGGGGHVNITYSLCPASCDGMAGSKKFPVLSAPKEQDPSWQ